MTAPRLGDGLRILWKRLAWAAAFTLVILASFWAWPPSLGPTFEVGRLATVVGFPTLVRDGRSPAITAGQDAPVHLGDRLETGDADRAEIQFHDGTTLRLAFNTTVELPPTARPPRNATNTLLRPPEVRLLKGQVWTKVAKRTNATPYAIHTDAATAVARGTEFGVHLKRIDAATNSAPSAGPDSRFAAVLTVKEGTVDFTNALGSVRATAMTESTARADSAPTEPRRLDALPTLGTNADRDWPILTAPLTGSVAARRLVPGGGWVGLVLRDFTNPAAGLNPAGSGASYEVRVARVEGGSPGDLAGVRPGDQVLSLNGTPVARAGAFERAVLSAREARLRLRLRREAEEWETELVVGGPHSQVSGPALSIRQLDSLTETTRRLLLDDPHVLGAAVDEIRDPAFRAAAENNLGVRWETEDLLGQAIRAYGQAVRTAPEVALYRFNLGLALRLVGSYERASEELEAAVRLAPGSTAARQRFAEIQSLLGRDSHALALTEAALQDDPGSHGLWELKAQLLWRQRRLDEAADAARQAIQLEPSCPIAHAYLGGVLQDQGQPEAAAQAYEETLRLAPFEASVHFRQGQVRQAGGRSQQAEQRFRQAIALQPALADAYVQLGLVLVSRGDLPEAERVLRQGREAVPDSSEIHNNLGEVLRNQGRSNEALACLQRAIELDPDNTAPINNLGVLHAQRHEYADAEAAFRTALERAPKLTIPPLLNLAMTLSEQHKVDASEEAYRKALVIAPNDPAVCNALAFFLAENDRHLDEALELSRSAVRTAPEEPNLQDTLGWVHFRRGELADAERMLVQALQLAGSSPASADIREHLRQVRARLDTSRP